VHPAEVGLAKASPGDLTGGDAAENAAIVRDVLAGTLGPRRDVVLLNAGAALLIAGVVRTLSDGITRAATAIDSGDARRTLDRLTAVSQRGGTA